MVFVCHGSVHGGPKLGFPLLLNQLHECPQILAFLGVGELYYLPPVLKAEELGETAGLPALSS